METRKGKTAFITGAAKGIGRACATRFVKEGWNVSCIDTDAAGLDKLQAELGGDRCYCLVCSTTSLSNMTAAATAAYRRFGQMDAVVANAGIHRSDTLTDVSEQQLREVIETNIYGTIYTLKAAIPHVSGGAIVIMASDQSTVGKAHSFSYGLTKGALGQIAKSLAIDLAPKGIRVNAVCPSTIATPLVDGVFARCVAQGADMETLWREENELFLRGSVGRPEEVAAMVYFLCSEEAAFCTGGLYPVDGGYTCR